MKHWTEGTTQQLRELWHAVPTLSAGEIGRRMGFSKNAIIGKAHRLDLTARPSLIVRRLTDEQRAARESKEPRIAPLRTLPPLPSQVEPPPRQVFQIIRTLAPVSAVVPPPVAPAPAPVLPFVAPVVKMPREPSHATCQWPSGDVRTRDFRVCGKPAPLGKPYCPSCATRAYVRRRPLGEAAD